MKELFVPVMGMAPDDVTLVSWLKDPGDDVAAGEAVAVIETAKAELEIESETAGVLGRRLFEQDARIAPGSTIAYVLDPGEKAPPEPANGVPAAETPAERPRHTRSPRQRRRELEAATAPEPPSTYREAITSAVSRSWQEIPHFAVSRELRADALVAAVGTWRTVLPDLTLTDLLLRALALSILERERDTDLDLGLAVATQQGVAVPVVRGVLRLGLTELVDARRSAVERARAGKLSAADGRTPVTTLSNLGAVGVDHFTGVIPYGQASMLTVGRAAPRPVVDESGQLAVATTMHATFNVDHRSWDGYDAGLLLDRLARIVADAGTFLGSETGVSAPYPKENP